MMFIKREEKLEVSFKFYKHEHSVLSCMNENLNFGLYFSLTTEDLNHHVHLGLFTEEQLDVVMETLMSIFCKKHHKVYVWNKTTFIQCYIIKPLNLMKFYNNWFIKDDFIE